MKRLKTVCGNCKYFKGHDEFSDEPSCRLHMFGKINDFLREWTNKKMNCKDNIKQVAGIPKDCPYIMEHIVLNGEKDE